MSQPVDKVVPPVADATALSPLKRAFLALEQAQGRVAALESAAREPIAVIGIGCRVPGGGDDAGSFWNLLREGVDAVSRVPASRHVPDVAVAHRHRRGQPRAPRMHALYTGKVAPY